MFYGMIDNWKGWFNNLLDRFGVDRSFMNRTINITQPESIPTSTQMPVPKKDLKDIIGDTSLNSQPQAEPEWHESRQNIMGNAKINTDNLRTSFQNVKDEIDSGIERLKGLKDNINQRSENESLFKPTPLDQGQLAQSGMHIASQIRTNNPHHENELSNPTIEMKDFNFDNQFLTTNTTESTNANEFVQERIITPTHDKIRHHTDKVDIDANDKNRDRSAYWVNDKKVL